MKDEIVICRGRVSSVSCQYNYNPETHSSTPDFSQPASTICIDSGFITDSDISNGTLGNAKLLTVQEVLEFGEEFEFVMRRVKKPSATPVQAEGPRQFKEEE